MAETLESIAGLFGFGEKQSNLPSRFAEVAAVSGDTASVIIGDSTVDAVRCCGCGVGDVVLVVTLPAGTLAAVATKGASGGGGGGVQSVTIGTVNGATFTNSGTAENVVLDLSVNAPYTLITNGVAHAFDQANYAYICKKYPDGTMEVRFSTKMAAGSGSGYNSSYYRSVSANFPSVVDTVNHPPAFVDIPYIFIQPRCNSNLLSYQVQGLTSTAFTAYVFQTGTASFPAHSVDVSLFGHWQ